MHIIAVPLIIATLGFIYFYLKPFPFATPAIRDASDQHRRTGADRLNQRLIRCRSSPSRPICRC